CDAREVSKCHFERLVDIIYSPQDRQTGSGSIGTAGGGFGGLLGGGRRRLCGALSMNRMIGLDDALISVMTPLSLFSNYPFTPAPASSKRAGSPGSKLETITKSAAPIETRALVRSPAARCRYWRSSPISEPNPKAAPSRTAGSIQLMTPATCA